MLKHNEENQHPIALSFADLSIWCYECDSYIVGKVFTDLLEHYSAEKFPPEKDIAEEIGNLVE